MSEQPKYPECEKLAAVRSDKLKLLAFLEWLEENNLHICTHDAKAFQGMGHYERTRENFERIVHRHFEIDEQKLEEERRAMLDAQREANET